MKQTLQCMLFSILWIVPSNFLLSQTVTTLHNFENTDGAYSRGNKLISDGTYFYGMTTFGGSHNKGTIFRIKLDGSDFEKLHDFNEENGAEPYNSLILVEGKLFGTTHQGGQLNRGVMFNINTDGSNYTKILEFTGDNGDLPFSTLISDGTFLYGSTFSGGIAGGGCIYKIRTDGTDFSIVHAFNGSDRINGSQPHMDYILDSSATYLYGVTFLGGENEKGIIYKIKTDGTGFQKLHDFDDVNGDYSGALLLLNDELYAGTLRGGANQKGIIYKIKTDGTGFTKLHDFEQMTGTESFSSLTFMDDFLYGTAISGGSGSSGVIFKMKPDGTEYTNIYAFNNESGYSPWSGMYFDGSEFYGINEGGGTHGAGTIYKFDPDGILAVNDNDFSDELSLFPNPVKDKLNVKLPTMKGKEAIIYDASGKLVLKQTFNNSKDLKMDVSQLKSGFYILQIEGRSVKFIKE